MKRYFRENILFVFLLILLTSCVPRESGDKKVVVWHWLTDRKDAFDNLAEQYKAETGIAVEFKLIFPPDIYVQKVISAARANNLPEVYSILGEKKTFASFIQAGHVKDLTAVMESDGRAWIKQFYPQALEVVRFSRDVDTSVTSNPRPLGRGTQTSLSINPEHTPEFKAGVSRRVDYGVPPGIYGVPIDMSIIQFVYNQTLFEEAGLNVDSPPATFSDFIKQASHIKEILGIDGFVSGWGEGWLLNCLATEWAINHMGEEKFYKTIKGDVPYTDRDWITVFDLFKQLADSGILSRGITNMVNKEAEEAFSRGKAAFSFNGSWAVNVYRQLNPDLDYRFFFPAISATNPLKVWGGAGSYFMANARSPMSEEAVRFLQWLTEPAQQEYLVRETNNLPAIKVNLANIPPVLHPLMENLDALTHPNAWPYNEDSRVIEVLNRGLQQIVMGLKIPQEIAAEIQREKEGLIGNE